MTGVAKCDLKSSPGKARHAAATGSLCCHRCWHDDHCSIARRAIGIRKKVSGGHWTGNSGSPSSNSSATCREDFLPGCRKLEMSDQKESMQAHSPGGCVRKTGRCFENTRDTRGCSLHQ